MVLLRRAPALDARTCSAEDVADAYCRHQLLLLEHATPNRCCLAHLQTLHRRHPEAVVEGWTAEHDQRYGQAKLTPEKALGPAAHGEAWYASIILRRGQAPDAFADVLSATPHPHALLDALGSAEEHLWLFFGRNASGTPMTGRPEHHDDVQCDGTHHLQLAGTKTWRLRPVSSIAAWAPRNPPRCPERLEVTVAAGSMLLLNTRLWFHETALPPQPGPEALSLSIARDFSAPGRGQEPAPAFPADTALARASPHSTPGHFASVLCHVQLCAWCGTPTGDTTAGRCSCLCCATRRGSTPTHASAAARLSFRVPRNLFTTAAAIPKLFRRLEGRGRPGGRWEARAVETAEVGAPRLRRLRVRRLLNAPPLD